MIVPLSGQLCDPGSVLALDDAEEMLDAVELARVCRNWGVDEVFVQVCRQLGTLMCSVVVCNVKIT